MTEKQLGSGQLFVRTRRITGYLNEDMRNFNPAKRAEVRDRVKHDTKLLSKVTIQPKLQIVS